MQIKKISFIVDPHQSQNRIFDFSSNNPVNRDGGVYPFYLLKNQLAEKNIQIGTQDRLSPTEADLLLFLDIPPNLATYPKEKLKYLIITESELIKPQNWNLQLHKQFTKIFTWRDDFVDNKKYFKLNFANRIYSTDPEVTKRPNFCCLIAGAKKNNHPLELYSKRVEAIRWFEMNAPEDFEFYGMGWDMYQFSGPIFIRALNRIKFLRRAFAAKFPSYRGRVETKKQILAKYQFSICYENAEKISGYVTEKIFDAMFAGCIAVYWGAPNVTDHVPANCFIDRRQFKTYEDLYQYMKNLTMDQVAAYQKNIQAYLKSPLVYPYSAEFFAEVLVRNIT